MKTWRVVPINTGARAAVARESITLHTGDEVTLERRLVLPAGRTALSTKIFVVKTAKSSVVITELIGSITDGIASFVVAEGDYADLPLSGYLFGSVTLDGDETITVAEGPLRIKPAPFGVGGVSIRDIAVTVPPVSMYGLPVVATAVVHDTTGAVVVAPLVWSVTAPPGIATINPATGALTVLADGAFTVIATHSASGKDGRASLSFSGLPVAGPPVATLAIATQQTDRLAIGDVRDLVVTVRDTDGDPIAGKTITAVSDSAHVTVSYPDGQVSDANGQVVVRATGVTAGPAVITASSGVGTDTQSLTVPVSLAGATLVWNPIEDAGKPRVTPVSGSTVRALQFEGSRVWTSPRPGIVVPRHCGNGDNRVGNQNGGEHSGVVQTDDVTLAFAPATGDATWNANSRWHRIQAPAFDPAASVPNARWATFEQAHGIDAMFGDGPSFFRRAIERVEMRVWLAITDAAQVGKSVRVRTALHEAPNGYTRIAADDVQTVVFTAINTPIPLRCAAFYIGDADRNAVNVRLEFPDSPDSATDVYIATDRWAAPPDTTLTLAANNQHLIDERFGAVHEFGVMQCAAHNHTVYPVSGVTIRGSNVPSPYREYSPDAPNLPDVQFNAGGIVQGQREMPTFCNDPSDGSQDRYPSYLWVTAWIEPGEFGVMPGDGILTARIVSTEYGGAVAPVALVRDPMQLNRYDDNGVCTGARYTARIKTPADAIRWNWQIIGTVAVRCCIGAIGFSPESYIETRNAGHHGMQGPPPTPVNNAPYTITSERHLKASCAFNIPIADIVRRQEGFFHFRKCPRYDIFQFAAMKAADPDLTRAYKFDNFQGGPGGSSALGMQSAFDAQGGGVVSLSWNQDAGGFDELGNPGTYDGTGFGWNITALGQLPAFTEWDLIVRWKNRGIDSVYIGIGNTPGAWYRNGDTLPNGWGTLTINTSVAGVGGVSATLWELSIGNMFFGSDRDFTGQSGDFSRGWTASKTDTPEDVIEAAIFKEYGLRRVYGAGGVIL